jgi:hypothetical protein
MSASDKVEEASRLLIQQRPDAAATFFVPLSNASKFPISGILESHRRAAHDGPDVGYSRILLG